MLNKKSFLLHDKFFFCSCCWLFKPHVDVVCNWKVANKFYPSGIDVKFSFWFSFFDLTQPKRSIGVKTRKLFIPVNHNFRWCWIYPHTCIHVSAYMYRPSISCNCILFLWNSRVPVRHWTHEINHISCVLHSAISYL